MSGSLKADDFHKLVAAVLVVWEEQNAARDNVDLDWQNFAAAAEHLMAQVTTDSAIRIGSMDAEATHENARALALGARYFHQHVDPEFSIENIEQNILFRMVSAHRTGVTLKNFVDCGLVVTVLEKEFGDNLPPEFSAEPAKCFLMAGQQACGMVERDNSLASLLSADRIIEFVKGELSGALRLEGRAISTRTENAFREIWSVAVADVRLC